MVNKLVSMLQTWQNKHLTQDHWEWKTKIKKTKVIIDSKGYIEQEHTLPRHTAKNIAPEEELFNLAL